MNLRKNLSNRPMKLLVALVICVCLTPNANADTMSTEVNIDQPGNDYRNFELSSPDPQQCSATCERESQCVAYTYVKPAGGKRARCWLKNKVPQQRRSACCVSGTKSRLIVPSAVPGIIPDKITLIASPRIDAGFQKWDAEHNFSDHGASYFFHWSYTGHPINRIAYEIKNKYGVTLKTQEMPTVQSGGLAQFQIRLGDLPKSNQYTVLMKRLDASGSETGDPSNSVVLTRMTPSVVPFEYAEWEIEAILENWNVPAVVGAVLCPSGQMLEYAAGIRKVGSSVMVKAGDLWHIGSDSKAITTLMLGKLVEEGLLDWDTDLLEDLVYGDLNLFPELKMLGSTIHSHFRGVTIEHLAGHRAGMNLSLDENSPTRVLDNYALDPRQFRWETVLKLLTRDHTGEPGEYVYGQGNFMVLAVIIERLRGKPFEDVIQEEIFDAIGMSTAAFSMPTDVGIPAPSGYVAGSTNPWVLDPHGALAVDTTAQPNGHRYSGTNMVVDNLALPPVWNAPGGVYLSAKDWLKFLRVHTHGSSGGFSLSSATLAKLQAPYDLPDRVDPPQQ